MKNCLAKLKKYSWFLCYVLIITTCLTIGTVWAKYKTEIPIGNFNLSISQAEQYYAVYSADDNSLEFYYGKVPKVNTEHNNKTVTAVYFNNIDTSTATTPEWSDIASDVKSVKFNDEIAPVSIKGWFSGFTNATSFDLTNLKTTNVNSISGLLSDCSALDTLTLGDNFGTSEQTFSDLGFDSIISGFTKQSENDITDYSPKNISLSNADTYTSVTYCYATIQGGYMRIYQRKYIRTDGGTVYSWRSGSGKTGYTTSEGGRPPKDESGNIRKNWSAFGTDSIGVVEVVDKVKPLSLDNWFKECRNLYLKDLHIDNLDTSDATSMAYMFYDCNKPTAYDLSHFNTSKVENMSHMFAKCWQLQELDLSSFDTSNVTNMTSMFDMTTTTGATNNLKTIIVSDRFVVEQVSSDNCKNMFTKCNLLMGGNGTTLTTTGNVVDKTYACIDKEGQLGYFTLKPTA